MAIRKPRRSGQSGVEPVRETHGSVGRLQRQVSVGPGGAFTIPLELCRVTGIEPGDVVTVEVTTDGKLLVRPPEGRRDPDQWWFWTDEWYEGEVEIDRMRASGDAPSERLSGAEFIALLQADSSED